jgi:hypothetical protein
MCLIVDGSSTVISHPISYVALKSLSRGSTNGLRVDHIHGGSLGNIFRTVIEVEDPVEKVARAKGHTIDNKSSIL